MLVHQQDMQMPWLLIQFLEGKMLILLTARHGSGCCCERAALHVGISVRLGERRGNKTRDIHVRALEILVSLTEHFMPPHTPRPTPS